MEIHHHLQVGSTPTSPPLGSGVPVLHTKQKEKAVHQRKEGQKDSQGEACESEVSNSSPHSSELHAGRAKGH